MATRIRTLNFLPEIFRTPTNSQFLQASLDQVVDQPNLTKIQGFIGSNVSYNLPVTSSLRCILNLNLKVSGSKIGAPSFNFKFWPTGSSPSAGSSTPLVDINSYFSQWFDSAYASDDKGVNENFKVATEFNTSVVNPGTYFRIMKIVCNIVIDLRQ